MSDIPIETTASHTHDPAHDPARDPTEESVRLVRETVTRRPWVEGLGFVSAAVVLLVVLNLWVTEPRPLAVPPQVAFGLIALIAAAWVGLLGWGIFFRGLGTSTQQVAAGWIGLAASLVFLVGGTVGALLQDAKIPTLAFAGVGTAFLAAAVANLVRAYSRRHNLRRREQRRQLEGGR